MPDSNNMVAEARAAFPRGLFQPVIGYRFSVDSLLLACFARPAASRGPARGLDLGAGCGVVGLGLALRHLQRPMHITGIEQDPELVGLARKNIGLLGLGKCLDMVQGDILNYKMKDRLFDFVVANPPYRGLDSGRVCPDPGRARARFETGAGIEDFSLAAAGLMRTRARFSLVYPADRLSALFAALARAGLEPKRMRLVQGRADSAARLVLVEAVKAGRPGLAVEPPLVLYAGRSGSGLTGQALAFCPFLGCNAGQ